MSTHDGAQLRAVVRRGMAELAIPGAAVGTLDAATGTRSTFGMGVTSYDHPLPVTDTTIFQIGSISKTFCATAAMVLVDQGAIDLDEPIRTYVPDLRLSTDELTETVTLRHVFTHTTGWVGDYFGNTGNGDDALARFVRKLAKAPQLTPLGETFSYNNSAFNLAAHAIATVAGRPYEVAVYDLVLRPLGLRHTFYATDDVVGRRLAIGHRDGRPQRWGRARAHHGNGGVLSCAADLLTYASFHLGDGAPIMSAAALAEMHRAQRPAGSLCDEIGVSWFLDRYGRDQLRVVHHGGTTNGYQADLRLAPDRSLAWVMLTNSDHQHQLDRMIREHLLGPDDVELRRQPMGDRGLHDYEGRYEAVLAELDLTEGDDGWLRAAIRTPPNAKWDRDDPDDVGRTTRLAFRDGDAMRVQALDMPFTAQRGEFLWGHGGTVEWLRWDGRISRRAPR